MLAPLGAFGSAAPGALRRGLRRVESLLRLLQTPKPLTDPALPADPTHFDRRLAQNPPFGPQISDFWQIFADQKFIENQTPQKPSQKAVAIGPWRPLGCPKSPFYDFSIDFRTILTSVFDEFLMISAKAENLEF